MEWIPVILVHNILSFQIQRSRPSAWTQTALSTRLQDFPSCLRRPHFCGESSLFLRLRKRSSFFSPQQGWWSLRSNSKHWFTTFLPSTPAVFSYAIGSRKLSANEQFFVGAQTVVSLLQTTQIKQGVSFTAANKVYTSTNKTTIVWINFVNKQPCIHLCMNNIT